MRYRANRSAAVGRGEEFNTATVTSTGEAVIELISLGAAALLLGASVNERAMETAPGQPRNVGQDLWRDFVTLRESFAEDIAEDTVVAFEYHYG